MCSVHVFPSFVFRIGMFRVQQSTKPSPSVCSPVQVSYSSLFQLYLKQNLIENSFNTNASLDFKYSVLLVND